MKRSIIIGAITAASLVAVAAIGLFSYQSVFAQTSPTPAAPSTTTPQNGQGLFGMGKGMRGGRLQANGVFEEQLAKALGITTDQLTAAYQTADSAALKQAVSKGLITQAQADAMAARGMFPRGLAEKNGIDYNALLAQALNITTDKLTAAQQTAETAVIDQAVTAGQITQQQADAIKARQALRGNTTFQNSMNTAFENALKQAVTDGVITQAQADALLAQRQQNQANGGFGGMFGGMFGGRFGGRGGRHGGFGGFFGGNGNGANNQQVVPSATPNGL